MPNDVPLSPGPTHHGIARSHTSLTGLFLVLILVCLALGATLSWALYERRERRELVGRLDLVSTRSGMVEARAGQLRQFLAHPGTRLIHLRGVDRAQGHTATIAWNPTRHEGILLLDPADVTPYRLVVRTAGETTSLKDLPPDRPVANPFTTPETLTPEAQFELLPLTGTAAAYIEAR